MRGMKIAQLGEKKIKKNTHIKVRYKKYGMGNPENGENYKYLKLYIRLFKLTLIRINENRSFSAEHNLEHNITVCHNIT